MARCLSDRQSERRPAFEVRAPLVIDHECEELRRLTGLVRLAIGRLGGSVAPWLDEGLLMGQGLITLLDLAGDADAELQGDHATVHRVVSSMRTWARASSWYRAAWPCRVGPLCSSLAERPADDRRDAQVALDLGVEEERLGERYAEAGLLFGVSPELLLPQRAETESGALSRAISALPLEQRKLLTLYFEDGLSFPEIAEALRITAIEAQTAYGRAATSIRAAVFGPRQSGACALGGGG